MNTHHHRRPYYFRGTTTAVSGLAVSRPDDNFASSTGSKDLQRLPRLGPKLDQSPVFFPGTQLRHLIREALLVGACKSAGGRLPLKDHFMLIQGVAIGELAKELNATSMEGSIEREEGLRRINPLISLGGFWKHAGTLGVNDWIPENTATPVHYLHSKMRGMPHKKNPELVSYLPETDVAQLKRIMTEDGDIARRVRDIDDEIKAIKKSYASATTAEKKKLGDQINQLEASKADIKNSKEGPTETLVRPVEGYEAICPGTVMRSGIDIARASELDLGFILYALREISKHPFVGAHFADGKGEFALDWQVRTWGDDLNAPQTLGRITVGLLSFDIIPEGNDKTLQAALELADAAFANPKKYGLDFSVFNQKNG
ncbi:hypothetical protein [Endozoicomonas atrinae]|uniref:hypothetical protein n=1 Tax=Endozoicomonas atrinae TaxID=1333660 RepID=UPI00082412F6|nr:hypothetical protein [Endozoicomonas atrinae]